MGTNFYWIDPDKVGVPTDIATRDHIGKRSAAGWYCWDCGVPLVRGGDIHLVHTSHDVHMDTCPRCGQGKPEENFTSGASAIELGFAEPRKSRKRRGVSSCSSFSYGQDPTIVQAICEQYANEDVVADEYGQEMTGQEFMSMVFSNCPIQFTHSIGVDFC